MRDCLYDRVWLQDIGAMRITVSKLSAVLIFLLLAINSGAPAFGQQISFRITTARSLPPCNLDSFVYQAGGHAESIYGDEGVGSKPPLANFTKASRIDAGITNQRDAGLTTGHGSYMPDGGGADEFLAAPGEWGQSGARGDSSASNMDGTAPSGPGDQTQTKESAGSAANGSLIKPPVNGQLSLVWGSSQSSSQMSAQSSSSLGNDINNLLSSALGTSSQSSGGSSQGVGVSLPGLGGGGPSINISLPGF